MSQPPDDHLKALWQGQETETKPMTVAAIRARAARFTNLRRGIFLFVITVALAQVAIFGRFFLTVALPGTAARVGMLVILVGLGWMIARISLLAPRRFPDAKASGESILDYHRTELERRETFGSLVVMVGPVLLGAVVLLVGVMVARPRVALQVAPLLVLIGCWFAWAWWLARWAEKKRQRKLAEIEATRVEPD